MSFWNGFFVDEFRFDDFPANARVLDVGFGEGAQMEALAERGQSVSGVDFSDTLVAAAKLRGLDVLQAPAEKLPYPDGSFDGIVCKVVLPYTNEEQAIREWSRTLKSGGTVLASYHGAGYYLRYLFGAVHWKDRIYGARSLINSWFYSLTQRRLPGFVGDTIYQSDRRLALHYRNAGFEIVSQVNGRTFAGFPVFIYHRLRRI